MKNNAVLPLFPRFITSYLILDYLSKCYYKRVGNAYFGSEVPTPRVILSPIKSILKIESCFSFTMHSSSIAFAFFKNKKPVIIIEIITIVNNINHKTVL